MRNVLEKETDKEGDETKKEKKEIVEVPIDLNLINNKLNYLFQQLALLSGKIEKLIQMLEEKRNREGR